MKEATNYPAYYTPEDTLTVSTRFSISLGRVLGAIKVGIKKGNKKGEHPKTFVSAFGDGLDSEKSPSFHIVFHRKLEECEKKEIEKAVIDIGRANKWVRGDVADRILFRWKVHNTNGYLDKHSNKWLWRRVC